MGYTDSPVFFIQVHLLKWICWNQSSILTVKVSFQILKGFKNWWTDGLDCAKIYVKKLLLEFIEGGRAWVSEDSF